MTLDAEREIEMFLTEYYRAFTCGEYERIAAEMYRAPVLMTTDEGVQDLLSQDQVRTMFEKTGATLAADGYASSELLRLEISVLSGTTALAATRFRRVRKDGSVIVEAGATYTLVREGSWRVSAAVLHDPDRLVALG